MADALELRAITNHGYYTDYFLAYRATSGLGDLFKGWKEQEKAGAKTARSRVAGLGRTFDQYRNTASELTPDEATGVVDGSVGAEKAHMLLIDGTLAAVGWHVPGPDEAEQDETVDHTERGPLSVARGGTEHHIPVAYARTLPTGPLLVAVDLVFSEDPETVTSDRSNPEARLLAPATTSTGAITARTLHEVADLLFGCDTPPRYVLACCGATLILVDRDTWYEGAWLAVNLDVLLAAKDTSPTGETAIAAALFGTATLDPGSEPTNLHDKLRADAARHGAGVSKELRRGMRRAVEALAQAVVHDLHDRKHANVLSNPQLDKDLTRQTLRYLYRLILLLYAEAHPELGVLPSRAREYDAGYGLERLRHLSGVRLETEAARQNNHIQQSLAILIWAVNEGHNQNTGSLFADGKALIFTALRSRLFDDDACPLIDKAHVPDETMQRVIRHLCFTEPKPGKRSESISFATLDVPQIGAVYEGLMSWTGTVASEPLMEVDGDGDPDNGSWTIPAHQADLYPETAFVKVTDEHGHSEKVRYEKYDFVYRLAGRDRERAAAFYTPRALTEFTVRHTLDEFFLANSDITAAELLSINICEPALGSGAFVNEAVSQLARHYLRLRQEELQDTIPAEDYPLHERRAKAHFAINQSFGVDLNEGGIELAEVSLWLNCMHAGMATPQLDARIRHGNTLIGVRRATYSSAQVRKAAYTGKEAVAPEDQPLDTVPLGSAPGIHHFLLPGEGWGVAAGSVDLRGKGGKKPEPGLASPWAEAVATWRKAISKKPTDAQVARLVALARLVETAWQAAADASARFNASTRQHIDGLYGVFDGYNSGRNDIARDEFRDPDSPTGRLRTLMNAWCSLWMWAPANGTALPGLDEWLDAAELLLGQPSSDQTGQLFTAHDLEGGTLESVARVGRARHAEIREKYPWIAECERLAQDHAFFHWELEHAHVFRSRGGFDLMFGNPPWAKLSRTDTDVLLDANPIAAIAGWDTAAVRGQIQTFTDPAVLTQFARECGATEGTAAFLRSSALYPLTSASLTNLYLCFIERVFRLAGGFAGLLHQESFYEDGKAAALTAEVYGRLRRHWHFTNEKNLFEDIHNETEFGIHVYGTRLPRVKHLYAANLLDPATLDRSLAGGGADGPLPGRKNDDDEWDVSPHPERILLVDDEVLATFARLSVGSVNGPPRLLRLFAHTELEVLERVLERSRTVASVAPRFSTGLHETSDTKGAKPAIEKRVAVPRAFSEAVIKGPNINVANPLYQEANAGYAHSKDNRILSLTDVEAGFVPRTVLQANKNARERMDSKSGWAASAAWRQVWPEHISRGWVRCFQPTLIPPGTVHGHSLTSMAFGDLGDLLRFHSLCTSTLYEYLIRAMGTDHLGKEEIGLLPYPEHNHPAWSSLVARAARMNCVTVEYGDLWAAVFEPNWRHQSVVASGDGRMPHWTDLSATWTDDIVIRNDYARWRTLIEMDALATLVLGVDPGDVERLWHQHLGLLRKYERRTAYDARGHRISGEFHNRGGRQTFTAQYGDVQAWAGGDLGRDVSEWTPPFEWPDRWTIFRHAYSFFTDQYAVGMSS